MINLIEFSQKWHHFMRNLGDVSVFLSDSFEKDCIALGFDLNTGALFAKKYGRASYNAKELEDILDYVKDTHLLGSAIYTRWYHFKYWASGSDEAMESHNVAWFELAFSYLEELAEEDDEIIQSPLTKVSLTTDLRSKGASYKQGDLVKQKLCIDINGSVLLVNYFYQSDGSLLEENLNISIGKIDIRELVNYFEIEFLNGHVSTNSLENGYWILNLTEKSGVKHEFVGSIYDGPGIEHMRYFFELGSKIPYERVFDFNNLGSENVSRVTFELLENEKVKESFVIEKTDTASSLKFKSGGLYVKYENEVVDKLLVFHDQKFSQIDGYNKNAIPVHDSTTFFRLNVEYEDRPDRFISGSYDRNSLPNDWGHFIEDISNTFNYIGVYDSFDSNLYNMPKRMQGDYIYLSVSFENGTQDYFFITDDETIAVGEYVVVPVGNNMGVKVGVVTKVSYFSEEDVPYPFNLTKRIIGRYEFLELEYE